MSEQATAAVGTDAAKTGHVKLSWREKICYGFGDFGNGFMFDLGQAYLTKYWIDVCTIPAGAVAGIFAFTKISTPSWTLSPVRLSTAAKTSAPAANSARS